ncbi:hypothetical protein DFR67_109124 [Williamsia limnetica]|uniref:Uncharacterized protein n=1 Tax=Williamsia limnetica TaxID=882452 RepID=A0A318RMQ1_WILLI|nr:hypothetical protein [Williamsia limnetica]PYE15896.1 hypothetical protein DFR67_109124 [Williamsia limnetica]
MHLSPNTSIYRARNGYVLRTADDRHYELTLPDREVDELLDVLGGNGVPESTDVSAVVAALVDSGDVVVRATLPTVAVHGSGRIAEKVVNMLSSSIIRSTDQADVVCHLSDDEVDPEAIGQVDLACYRDGISQVITPRAVAPGDVIGRRRACNLHRDRIPSQYRPVGGRRLDSPEHPVSDRAAELIAHLIVDEIGRRGVAADERSHYLLTVVDLRTLTSVRRPVLPIPSAPQ